MEHLAALMLGEHHQGQGMENPFEVDVLVEHQVEDDLMEEHVLLVVGGCLVHLLGDVLLLQGDHLVVDDHRLQDVHLEDDQVQSDPLVGDVVLVDNCCVGALGDIQIQEDNCSEREDTEIHLVVHIQMEDIHLDHLGLGSQDIQVLQGVHLDHTGNQDHSQMGGHLRGVLMVVHLAWVLPC